MNRKQSTKKGSTKGRAEGSKGNADHEQVAQMLADILHAEPEGREAEAIIRRASQLGGAIGQSEIYDLRPAYMLCRLLDAHTVCAYDLDGQDGRKGRRAYSALVALAGRRARAYEVARSCTEIYEAAAGDGATYFMEHVDAVTQHCDGLVPNPDSEFFTRIFVEAFDALGPRDRDVRRLLDLIKRVDEGADLNELHDEGERTSSEREQANRPKDALLVDALSAVVADPKREEERVAILDAINTLSNNTIGVYDFHPEIFPVLARVVLREGRRSQAGKGRGFAAREVRDSIRRLEEIADEKGGAR